MARFILLLGAVLVMAHSCNGGSVWDQTKSWQNDAFYDNGTAQLAGQTIKIDIVQSEADREKGLAGRSGIEDSQGMLFLFDQSAPHAFWMKGMLFPIDLVWIQDNKVVDIVANAPPMANAESDADYPVYEPKANSDSVLELKAGWARQFNLQKGDEIRINANK